MCPAHACEIVRLRARVCVCWRYPQLLCCWCAHLHQHVHGRSTSARPTRELAQSQRLSVQTLLPRGTRLQVVTALHHPSAPSHPRLASRSSVSVCTRPHLSR
eukprot:5139318-Alexandrium_andersonii.AAC.1